MNTDAIPAGDRWGTEQIATYLGLTRRYVTDEITKRRDFPKPVLNVSQRTRRWAAEQVRRWAAGEKS